ncbi:MAG: ABC transporter permease [Planctomycetaceae bacterium]|nr:ABC transporter permease [Planctomycetaceae bacterium]
MYAYISRSILLSLVTLLIITCIVFGLIRNMPGTPLTIQQSEMADPSRMIGSEDLKMLEKAYGLDKPWPVAYVYWIGHLLTGDLGSSFTYKRPVTEVISERFFATLVLSISSLFLTYLFSIPLGLYSTVRSGSLEERATSTFLYILYSFPVLVAALYLQIYFAVKLDWLPISGMTTLGEYEKYSTSMKVWDIFKHALMPVICTTYGSLAYYSRFVHSNMQETIRQDYVRTARAKGAGPMSVLIRHAFRNTLIPLVTLIGLTLPGLLGGSIIIERIFQWPGMGQLFFQAISDRDYPVIMGLTLMFSVLTLLGQLLADILYVIVDPRVRLS